MTEKAERTAAPGPPGPGAAPGAATSEPATGTPAQRARRQRRPTGAPPPLPHPITISTTAWLLLAVIIVAGAFLFSEQTPWLRLGDRANTWILRLIADVRTPWLTDVADAIKAAGSSWAVTVIGLSVVALTMIFRRWRHLLVFFSSFFFLGIVADWIYSGLTRPRPYGITIISGWGGYSAPSLPVATLTIVLMGAVYCLVVPGRPRTYAKIAVAVVVTLFCLARIYLAVDHPDDVRLRRRARRGHTGRGLPLVHPERGVPGRLPPRQDRSRGRDRAAWPGDPDGGARPARAERARDQAGRPGIVGRFHAAAAARRRGARQVPVREAVHQGPRTGRSLVQGLADHPLRHPGRRESLPDGAPADRVRGPHAAAPAG